MKIKQSKATIVPKECVKLIFSFLPSYILQRDYMVISKDFHNFVISTIQERRKTNLFNFSIHRKCFHFILPKKYQITCFKFVFPNYLLVYTSVDNFFLFLVFNLSEEKKILEKKFLSSIEFTPWDILIEGDEELFTDVDVSKVVNKFHSTVLDLKNGFKLQRFYRNPQSELCLKDSAQKLDSLYKKGKDLWRVQKSPHQNNQFLLILVKDWVLYEIKNSKLKPVKTNKNYFKLLSKKEELLLFYENGIDFYDKETDTIEQFFEFECSIHEICEMNEQYLAISSYYEIFIFDIFNVEICSKIKRQNGKISKISSFGGYLISNSIDKKNEISIFEFDTL
jgi:hypothetical protein